MENAHVICAWNGDERAGTLVQEDVSAQVLSEFLRFDVKDTFYAVRWDDDHSLSLVPGTLFRLPKIEFNGDS